MYMSAMYVRKRDRFLCENPIENKMNYLTNLTTFQSNCTTFGGGFCLYPINYLPIKFEFD